MNSRLFHFCKHFRPMNIALSSNTITLKCLRKQNNRDFLCLIYAWTKPVYFSVHAVLHRRKLEYLTSTSVSMAVFIGLYVKPLSHQGGVLAAFYKNAERQGERRENSMDAVATRWELHRTPWEILERQGSVFLLDMLKTNAITRRSNKSAVRTPWQRSENFINSAGAP